MDVLVSGHGEDRGALDAARRLVPYHRLVLFTSGNDAKEVDALRENESLANVRVDVVRVDAGDFLACLEAGRAAMKAGPKDRVRVHVAGGPNLLTSALLLAAFLEGREAFYCHARGVSWLPVAVEVRVEDRFQPADRSVLQTLPPKGESEVTTLSVEGLTPFATKGALLRLRALGLVRADHQKASLTPTGRYYREHFVRPSR